MRWLVSEAFQEGVTILPLPHQEGFWGDQRRKLKCLSTTAKRLRREEPLHSLRKSFLFPFSRFLQYAGIMTFLLQRHVLPEAK